MTFVREDDAFLSFSENIFGTEILLYVTDPNMYPFSKLLICQGHREARANPREPGASLQLRGKVQPGQAAKLSHS